MPDARLQRAEYLGVAPFTGAWIEMLCSSYAALWRSVAPFTGAWIEIPDCQ